MAGGYLGGASGGGFLYPNVQGGGGGGGGSVNSGNANTWSAAQTLGLEDAGTNTVLQPLIVQRTSSGTAAAGLGVGVSLRAEDASGNTDEAATFEAAWVTATDGATQASRAAVRVRTANAMVETMRVYGGTTLSTGDLVDVDAVLNVGRATIDSRITDNAFFGHRDQVGTTAAHLRITAAGTAILNCTSGQSTSIRHADTTRIQVNTTGIGFFAATPVAQQAVSGSRGGNAALASVLTALANLGLITDGSSA